MQENKPKVTKAASFEKRSRKLSGVYIHYSSTYPLATSTIFIFVSVFIALKDHSFQNLLICSEN